MSKVMDERLLPMKGVNNLFENNPAKAAYAKFRKLRVKRTEETSYLSITHLDSIMTTIIDSFEDAASLSANEQLSDDKSSL